MGALMSVYGELLIVADTVVPNIHRKDMAEQMTLQRSTLVDLLLGKNEALVRLADAWR